MADIQGVTGSSVRASRAASVMGAVGAVDGQGGRGGSADGPQSARSRGVDLQTPQIIRFEGMVLDPNAPRGTYLDILV